jgi:hypothetical protein
VNKITTKHFDKVNINAYDLMKCANKNAKGKIIMKKIHRSLPLVLAMVLAFANILLLAPPANAASLTNSTIRLNRMAAGQDSTVRVIFKTVGSGATSVVISMNGADASTWTGSTGTVSTTQAVAGVAGCDVGATALPGSLAAAGSGNTITISSVTALTAATIYCADLTTSNSVHNPTAGEYHPTITVGSDSTTTAVRVVTNDQILVTAVVPPSFNFALGTNADAFTANLASGTVGITTGVTATVNTNAKTGWIAWARDSSTGLASTAAGKTIASTTPGTSATLSAGTEGFTMGVTAISQGSGLGVTSVPAAYDATGAAHGSGLDATLRQIASSTGTASTATFTMKERAAISALTPAANDYTDTITVIGAGSF